MNGAIYALAAVVLAIIAMAVYAFFRDNGGPTGPEAGLGDSCTPGGGECVVGLVCRPTSPGGEGACLPPSSASGLPPPGCPTLPAGQGGTGGACKGPCGCRAPNVCNLASLHCVDGTPGQPPPGCPAITPGYGGVGDDCDEACECRVPYECDLNAHKCVAGR